MYNEVHCHKPASFKTMLHHHIKAKKKNHFVHLINMILLGVKMIRQLISYWSDRKLLL